MKFLAALLFLLLSIQAYAAERMLSLDIRVENFLYSDIHADLYVYENVEQKISHFKFNEQSKKSITVKPNGQTKTLMKIMGKELLKVKVNPNMKGLLKFRSDILTGNFRQLNVSVKQHGGTWELSYYHPKLKKWKKADYVEIFVGFTGSIRRFDLHSNGRVTSLKPSQLQEISLSNFKTSML